MLRLRYLEKNTDKRKYVGIERGLHYVNGNFISLDYDQSRRTTSIVEKIAAQLVQAMKKECHTFNSLYTEIFKAGSSYEGLKVVTPEEFDLDVVLKFPDIVNPVLKENNIPGYVNIVLENLEHLQHEDNILYEDIKTFVDDDNYLLTAKLKSFMQSRMDRAFSGVFPDRAIIVGNQRYLIRVESLGPAFSLKLVIDDLDVSVDLVPCILLDNDQWPQGGFRDDPYSDDEDPFLVVPKSPKLELAHIERYWRLSFQKQERQIIYHRMWLKPTLRVLKCIRDHFGHKVSSYALKTIFFWQMYYENPDLDDALPELWVSPFSYCVVYMLERYMLYLRGNKVPYFWNKKRNLLDNLSDQQMDHYARTIENMLTDIKERPSFDTIVKYFSIEE